MSDNTKNTLKKILYNFNIVITTLALTAIFILYYFNINHKVEQFNQLDDKALSEYIKIGNKLLNTQNVAEAFAYKVKVTDKDLTKEDVGDLINSLAADYNFRVVADSVMSNIHLFKGDIDHKYHRMVSLCDPKIAVAFLDYSSAYSIFMPCRIIVTEEENGDIYIYTMAMDLFVNGGRELPPKLKAMAIKIKSDMYSIIDRASIGDF
jgi:uncharacterized protein (DUF302 family)